MKYCLFIAGILFVVFCGFAQEPPSADQMKIWVEWEKLMKPGAEHALLGKFVGDWNVTSKWYASKDAQPQESKATSSAKWIFGGRFVQTDFRGEMNGTPFTGLGFDGYDTVKKKYTMLWMDELGTAMYTALGTASPEGKTITYMGQHDDPMTGEIDVPVKYMYTLVAEHQHIFQIIEKPGTPDEYTAMEMVYTRK
jgi:hypothetical protein